MARGVCASERLSAASVPLAPHGLPLTGLGRFQHRVGDVVGRERVAEGRRCRVTAGETCEEIGGLVDEGMLVADLQAGHPPMAHIGMLAVADVDRAPAAQLAFVAM